MFRWAYGLGALALLGVMANGSQVVAGNPLITWTQTGCQFVEPEGKDLGIKPMSAKECRTYNKSTRKSRLKGHKPLDLAPGEYTFEVRNTDVPYELGFYLRAADRDLMPFMPRVSGGGIHKGQSKSFTVNLMEGDYVYSCPFNPTINYRIRVK